MKLEIAQLKSNSISNRHASSLSDHNCNRKACSRLTRADSKRVSACARMTSKQNKAKTAAARSRADESQFKTFFTPQEIGRSAMIAKENDFGRIHLLSVVILRPPSLLSAFCRTNELPSICRQRREKRGERVPPLKNSPSDCRAHFAAMTAAAICVLNLL